MDLARVGWTVRCPSWSTPMATRLQSSHWVDMKQHRIQFSVYAKYDGFWCWMEHSKDVRGIQHGGHHFDCRMPIAYGSNFRCNGWILNMLGMGVAFSIPFLSQIEAATIFIHIFLHDLFMKSLNCALRIGHSVGRISCSEQADNYSPSCKRKYRLVSKARGGTCRD